MRRYTVNKSQKPTNKPPKHAFDLTNEDEHDQMIKAASEKNKNLSPSKEGKNQYKLNQNLFQLKSHPSTIPTTINHGSIMENKSKNVGNSTRSNHLVPIEIDIDDSLIATVPTRLNQPLSTKNLSKPSLMTEYYNENHGSSTLMKNIFKPLSLLSNTHNLLRSLQAIIPNALYESYPNLKNDLAKLTHSTSEQTLNPEQIRILSKQLLDLCPDLQPLVHHVYLILLLSLSGISTNTNLFTSVPLNLMSTVEPKLSLNCSLLHPHPALSTLPTLPTLSTSLNFALPALHWLRTHKPIPSKLNSFLSCSKSNQIMPSPPPVHTLDMFTKLSSRFATFPCTDPLSTPFLYHLTSTLLPLAFISSNDPRSDQSALNMEKKYVYIPAASCSFGLVHNWTTKITCLKNSNQLPPNTQPPHHSFPYQIKSIFHTTQLSESIRPCPHLWLDSDIYNRIQNLSTQVQDFFFQQANTPQVNTTNTIFNNPFPSKSLNSQTILPSTLSDLQLIEKCKDYRTKLSNLFIPTIQNTNHKNNDLAQINQVPKFPRQQSHRIPIISSHSIYIPENGTDGSVITGDDLDVSLLFPPDNISTSPTNIESESSVPSTTCSIDQLLDPMIIMNQPLHLIKFLIPDVITFSKYSDNLSKLIALPVIYWPDALLPYKALILEILRTHGVRHDSQNPTPTSPPPPPPPPPLSDLLLITPPISHTILINIIRAVHLTSFHCYPISHTNPYYSYLPLFLPYTTNPGPYQLPQSTWKSLLQKTIRHGPFHGSSVSATKLALQLVLKEGLSELLRRILIITVEDTCLHPGFPFISYMMLMSSKKNVIENLKSGEQQREISPSPWSDATTSTLIPKMLAQHEEYQIWLRNRPQNDNKKSNSRGTTKPTTTNSTTNARFPQFRGSNPAGIFDIDSTSTLKLYHLSVALTFVHQIASCPVRDPLHFDEIPAEAIQKDDEKEDGGTNLTDSDEDSHFFEEDTSDTDNHTLTSSNPIQPDLSSNLSLNNTIYYTSPLTSLIYNSEMGTEEEWSLLSEISSTQIETESKMGVMEIVMVILRDISIAFQHSMLILERISKSIPDIIISESLDMEYGGINKLATMIPDPPNDALNDDIITPTRQFENEPSLQLHLNRKYLPSNSVIPFTTLSFLSPISHMFGLTTEQLHIIQAILLRASFGGMGGDIKMCFGYAYIWLLRFAVENIVKLFFTILWFYQTLSITLKKLQYSSSFNVELGDMLPSSTPNLPLCQSELLLSIFSHLVSPKTLQPASIHTATTFKIKNIFISQFFSPSSLILKVISALPTNFPVKMFPPIPSYNSSHFLSHTYTWMAFLNWIYTPNIPHLPLPERYGISLMYNHQSTASGQQSVAKFVDKNKIVQNIHTLPETFTASRSIYFSPPLSYSTNFHGVATSTQKMDDSKNLQKVSNIFHVPEQFVVIPSPKLINPLTYPPISAKDMILAGIDAHCSNIVEESLLTLINSAHGIRLDDPSQSIINNKPLLDLSSMRHIDSLPITPKQREHIILGFKLFGEKFNFFQFCQALLFSTPFSPNTSFRSNIVHFAPKDPMKGRNEKGIYSKGGDQHNKAYYEQKLELLEPQENPFVVPQDYIVQTLSSIMWNKRSSINNRIKLKNLYQERIIESDLKKQFQIMTNLIQPPSFPTSGLDPRPTCSNIGFSQLIVLKVKYIYEKLDCDCCFDQQTTPGERFDNHYLPFLLGSCNVTENSTFNGCPSFYDCYPQDLFSTPLLKNKMTKITQTQTQQPPPTHDSYQNIEKSIDSHSFDSSRERDRNYKISLVPDIEPTPPIQTQQELYSLLFELFSPIWDESSLKILMKAGLNTG